jgi:hypothetical protein
MIIVLRDKKRPTVTTSGGIYSRVVGGVTMLYCDSGVIRERSIGDGDVLYAVPPEGEWEHPWYTRVMWSETMKDAETGEDKPPGFAAVVKPGYVNGLDPVSPSSERIEVYSEEVDGLGNLVVQYGQPGLLDEPLIPLDGPSSWKRVGLGVAMPYRIKKYFEAIGVDVSGGGMSVQGQTLVVNETSKSMYQQMAAQSTLVKTDIYVAVTRPTLRTQQVPISDGYGTPLFDYTVGFDNTAATTFPRPRILVGENPMRAGGGVDSSATGAAGRGDEGVDYFGVATVYALAPKDWEPPGDSRARIRPDRAWSIFVAYEAFWNLEHRARDLQPVSFKSMTVGPIMGGLGGSLIAPAVAAANLALNSGNKLMSDVLNSKTNEGIFWSV